MIDANKDSGGSRATARTRGIMRWSTTTTGAIYLVLLAAAAVLLAVSVEAAVAVMLVALATVVPLKLSIADDTRRQLWAQHRDDVRRIREIEELIARLEERVAAGTRRDDHTDEQLADVITLLTNRVAAVRQEIADRVRDVRREITTTSQGVQRVALGAVDVARGEWADLLRAERRRTAAVRWSESRTQPAAQMVIDHSADSSETPPTRLDRHR